MIGIGNTSRRLQISPNTLGDDWIRVFSVEIFEAVTAVRLNAAPPTSWSKLRPLLDLLDRRPCLDHQWQATDFDR